MSIPRLLTEYEINSIVSFIKPQKGIPIDTAMSVVNTAVYKLKHQLKSQKIYPVLIPSLKENIERQYALSQIQAGESVGVIGAQSIGEKQTQSTLNSVDWTDRVLYTKDGNVVVEQIGQMIDRILIDNKDNIQKFQKNNTDYLELPEGYFIPSGSEDGFNEWLRIEAVTRHLPNGKLVKVVTQSGRTVMASQCKSFLVWNGMKFDSTLGSDVKVGDILPTTKNLNRFGESKKFFNFQDKTISNNLFSMSLIPDKIPLDNDFGFFLGIYLSQGWCTKTVVGVVNNNIVIRKRVTDWLDRYGVTYHNDLEIQSTLLARMFKITCETGPENKFIPMFAYTAPKDFIKGLIDGYFSGNCLVNKKGGNIFVTTVSEQLIHGVSFLLSYFKIFGIFSRQYVGCKYIYKLTICNKFVQQFASCICLTDSKKQYKLQNITLKQERSQEEYPHDRDVYFDKIVSVEYVEATTGLVYDLTVSETRNFNLFNGLNCRDTFHKAGSGATTGVPRVEEMLNATKDPKSVNCVVHTKKKHKSISDLRNTIGHDIVEITFSKITKSYEIMMDKKPETWYKSFKIMYGDTFTQFTDCVSLKLDMDILYEYKLDMETIKDIIAIKYSDMICVFSPDNIGQLDIFVDTSNIDLPENRLIFINTDNAREIYLDEVVQPILYNIVICGVPGIENIYFNDNPNKFETKGSNFKKLIGIPFVDDTLTVSNNVWDIYNTLGVEAARQFLVEEFMQLCSGINKCHIQLLAEKMTHSGSISSISRYAMRNEDCGPIGKASFEETMDNFLKAGVNGQTDDTNGVSASIICGKRANIGTGVCEIMMDVKALPNRVRVLHEVEETMSVGKFNSVITPIIDKSIKADKKMNEPYMFNQYERSEPVLNDVVQLTENDFSNGKIKMMVYFGSVEMDMKLVFDTKNPQEIYVRWKDGLKVGKEIFSGFDSIHGVYMPLKGVPLKEQGRFMSIVNNPVVVSKKIKSINKLGDLQQMNYLDF